MKSNIMRRITAMAVIAIAGISAANASMIPYTEEYFPDQYFRYWLTRWHSDAIVDANGNKVASPDINGGGQFVNTDKVTTVQYILNGTIVGDCGKVEDLSCLRYFTKLTGELTYDGSSHKSLKRINISGIPGITALKQYTSSGAKNATTILEEVIADNCPNLKTLELINCLNIKTVSIRNCNNLETCNIYINKGTNKSELEFLDLSNATKLTGTINLSANTKLRELRLGDADGQPYYTNLKGINAANCALEAINLKGFTYDGTDAKTLNFYNNSLRDLDLSAVVYHPKTNTGTQLHNVTIEMGNNAIPVVNTGINNLYENISTFREGPQTCYLGNVKEIDLPDYTMVEYSNFKYSSRTNQKLIFNEGVKTVSYTVKNKFWAGSPGDKTVNVTINRHLDPLEVWVVFEADGWDKNKGYKLNDLGSGNGNIYHYTFGNENTLEDDRWESYRFLVKNESGAEYFIGGSPLDAVIPSDYPDIDANSISPAEFETLFHAYVPVPQNNFSASNIALVKDSSIPFCCLQRRSHPWQAVKTQSQQMRAVPAIESEGDGYSNHSMVLEWADGWTHHGTSRSFAVGSDNVMTGIDSVFDDSFNPEDLDGTPAYFNLQGVYMGSELPGQSGIYIKRQGTKSQKILVN